jgi:hypothetical protein
MLEREAARYRPDLVLLCYVLNDAYTNPQTSGHGMTKPRYVRGDDGGWRLDNHPAPAPPPEQRLEPTLAQRIRASSALVRVVTTRGARSSDLGPNAHFFDLPEDEARLAAGLVDEIADPNSLARYLLGRIHAKCRELGAPLVVFVAPSAHDQYLYSTLAPLPPEIARGDYERPYKTLLTRRIEQAARDMGFHAVSVDQALLDAMSAGRPLHVPGDDHYNRRGNEVVARELARALQPILAEIEPE